MILVVLLFIFENFNCFTLNFFSHVFIQNIRGLSYSISCHLKFLSIISSDFWVRWSYNFVFFLAFSLDFCFVLNFGLVNWIAYKLFPCSRFFELQTSVDDLDKYSELAFVTVAFRTLYAEKGNKKLHLYAYIYIL